MKKSKRMTLTLCSKKLIANKQLLAFSLSLFFSFFVNAQIGGVWSGTLVNDSTGKKQTFELGLSEYRGKITGYTYTTFIENDTFYYSIKKIKAEKKDGQVIITDAEMVANNFPERAAKGVKQTTVFPLVNDSTIDLANGRWNTNSTKKYYSIYGSATLSEVKKEKESDLLAHLGELSVKTNLVVREERKKQTERVVTSSNDQPKHDVTVTRTKPQVIEKKPVSTQPANTAMQPTVVYQGSPSTSASSSTTMPGNKVIQQEQQPMKLNSTQVTSPSASTNVTESKVTSQEQQPTKINSTQATSPSSSTNVPENKVVYQQQKPTATNNIPSNTKSQKNNAVPVTSKPNTTTNEVTTQQTAIVKNNSHPMESKTDIVAVPVEIRKATSSPTVALPAVVAGRKNENVQQLYFKNDSLVLSLYDNGIVDGDTVSVFMNGTPIISKQQLKESALKKTVQITPDMDSVQLVLFADNLGSIPPNTGLLTIRDGDEIYQVRFSADLQRNAAIILQRKKTPQ